MLSPFSGATPEADGMRPIPGFHGYFATPDGSIWSQLRLDERGPRRLRPAKSSTGYLTVSLVVDGKAWTKKVHRLIALTFHGSPPPGKRCVRHLDGDRLNNESCNLSWASHKENEADKVAHRTSQHGERNHQARLSANDVAEIRRLVSMGSYQRVVASAFGVSQGTVSAICSRRTWASVG